MNITIEFNELKTYQDFNQNLAHKLTSQLRVMLSLVVFFLNVVFLLFLEHQFQMISFFKIENQVVFIIFWSLFVTLISRIYIINKVAEIFRVKLCDQNLDVKYRSIFKDIFAKLNDKKEILQKYLDFLNSEQGYILARYSSENVNFGISSAIEQYFEYKSLLNPYFLHKLKVTPGYDGKRYFYCKSDEFLTNILNAYTLKDTFYNENVAIELNALHMKTKDTHSSVTLLDTEIRGKAYSQYLNDHSTNICKNTDYLISLIEDYELKMKNYSKVNNLNI